jgi:hypothetical protein
MCSKKRDPESDGKTSMMEPPSGATSLKIVLSKGKLFSISPLRLEERNLWSPALLLAMVVCGELELDLRSEADSMDTKDREGSAFSDLCLRLPIDSELILEVEDG